MKNLADIFEKLPLSEKTLIKHYKKYPFIIKNDRGHPCHWYIYENSEPVAMIKYYRGRKLACYTLKARS